MRIYDALHHHEARLINSNAKKNQVALPTAFQIIEHFPIRSSICSDGFL